jgi:CRP-like cAMP-binding protein
VGRGGRFYHFTSLENSVFFARKNMENENLYQKMESYCPISSALKAYLNIALTNIELPANHILHNALFEQYQILFIENGTCKTTLQSKKEPDQSILTLHLKNTFLTPSPEKENEDYSIQTTTLSLCTLIGIPEKHIHQLYRLFPEFINFNLLLHQQQKRKLFHLAFDIRYLSVEERFNQLLTNHPDIFQISSSIDIANSLGIHSHTLSTLKHNYFSRKNTKP